MIDLKPNDDKNIKKVLEEDYIGRNKYLNGLIHILNRLEESKIIALDGDWGSGKTFFLKSLEYLISHGYDKKYRNISENDLNKLKQEYMVFYYNAWENDDAPSAMLSLIYKLINDSCLKKEENAESNIPKIFNAIVKFKTGGNLDFKNFLAENWTNKKITEEIETSEEIKEKFRELINNLLVENKNKMLIIIDEIDRCKPTFAIDLLENIKHFYDDDRVIFIVATNNKQLGASVCKVYGEKYDGYAYLDKFFDMNLELPNNYLEKFINAIDENQQSSKYYFKCCREIAKYKKVTMREYTRYLKSINSLESYLTVIRGEIYLNTFTNHLFIPLALCLKIKEKEKYYEFISGNLFEEIEKLIETNDFFYDIAHKIVLDKNRRLLAEIKELQISEEEKSIKIREKIIATIKSIYNILLVNNPTTIEFWEIKEGLDAMLDIISMMN